jgi:hypothetical protein
VIVKHDVRTDVPLTLKADRAIAVEKLPRLLLPIESAPVTIPKLVGGSCGMG